MVAPADVLLVVRHPLPVGGAGERKTCSTGTAEAAELTRVHAELGAEAVGDLERPLEVGVADDEAHDAYRDLMELSSWYVAAVSYELDVLEGFLLDYVPSNSLVINGGDDVLAACGHPANPPLSL